MLLQSILLLHLVVGDPEVAPAFEEVAAQVGLDFTHYNFMSGALYTPELTGAGVALFDYDNDGDLDVYLGQGNPMDEVPLTELTYPPPEAPPLSDRLYRNDLEVRGDGSRVLRFSDVTKQSGLEATGYAMGVAAGDFDNDGWIDLYVTNLGSNQLLRNRGDGTFEDVTAEANADDRRWSVAATFFDFDRDGWLDLFVGNYHRFSLSIQKPCYRPNGVRDYCGPLAYPPEEDRLLHNRGDGTFEDVTARAGLAGSAATTLGAVAADFDGDSFLDLYVANDLMSNWMWLNQGDGTFVDDALLRGTALDGNGRAQASMGVLAEDLNGDGAVDLFMTHLQREYNTLYLNDGSGNFEDASWSSGLGRSSWEMTAFGTVMLDYDGDGIQDIFVANGAVHRIPEQLEAGDPHPLRLENQLFRGLGDGRFEEVPAARREHPVESEVSRGLAVGDVDNDGDPDLVISNNAGPVRLLLNQRSPRSRWIGLRVVERMAGGGADRDAYGARAAVLSSATGTTGWQRVHTDGSYAAASDPRLLAVLGGAAGAADVEVRWLDGPVEVFEDQPVGGYVVLRRGEGRGPSAAPNDTAAKGSSIQPPKDP